jgi:hypothetical protein
VQDLRRIPFFISVFLVLLIVSAETGGALAKTRAGAVSSVCGGLVSGSLLKDLGIDLESDDGQKACGDVNRLRADVSGLGVPYLALVDGILLFILLFMAVGLVVPESITGRIQGAATLIFSLLMLLAAVAMIFAALTKLLLMLGLLLSVPFGTIAYFAMYASFPRSAMLALLGTTLLLKFAAVAALIAGQQRFLQNKALVFLILTSFVASLVVSLLLGFVPGFLASITDALAAIVVGVIAAIWLLILLVSSIPAIIKAAA